MLDTLIKIGHWKRQSASEWDRFLDAPKIQTQDKKGNSIKNYILPIIFDLDSMDVIIDGANLKEYDEERDVIGLKVLKILPGRFKKFYCSVPFSKLDKLYVTYFGKLGNQDVEEADFIKILKDFKNYGESQLYQILERVFPLKDKFLKLIFDEEQEKIYPQNIIKLLDLQKNEAIALIYVCIKASEFGLSSQSPFAELAEYEEFLKIKLIGDTQSIETKDAVRRLCYASGELDSDVEAIELKEKYSLNKMFVTTTINYASSFNKKGFNCNYQVSKTNQINLDNGSKFLLKNYKTRIADVDHVIVPQLLKNENIELDMILEGIKKKSNILFSLESLTEMAKDIESSLENIFWINFIAFESDGKFFKSTNIIKDVSRFHFQNIIDTFISIDWELKEDTSFTNWDLVMTEYKDRKSFNLYSVYKLIPVRKGKEKKNIALELFKAILENRKIEGRKLYKHFTELILCHYFVRYKSYTNVVESTKEYFGKAVRDSVFKYLAFFQVLRRLELINMEPEKHDSKSSELAGDKYGQVIQNFFEKMAFNQQQKAMFYLGRMLSTVDYMQKDKNKTVIDKVNFNGMDRDKIVRLRLSLFEKAKQYGKSYKVVFSDASFSEHFNFSNWDLDPNEAVFFILTGFSFGAKAKDESKEQESTNSNQDEK